MLKKVFSAEQIIARLWEIEMAISEGKTAATASREAGISELPRDFR